MSGKKFFALFFSSIMMLMPGCNWQTAPPAQDTTAIIETRVAELVASTVAAQAAVATSVAATMIALNPDNPMPVNSPEATFTPVFTFTPQAPMVSVSVQTNCRSGPGSDYEVLGIMNVGENAEVVGRSAYNDNWIIKLPSNPAITCWLWGQYATVRGDFTVLPIINPPPTPKPGNNFGFYYQNYWDCSGISLVIFNLKNSGSLPWESNQVSTTDLVTSVTQIAVRDDFPSTFNCAFISNADDQLDAGQTGSVISAALAGLPTGHEFMAIIRLCTGEGLTGVCMDKTISFTFTP